MKKTKNKILLLIFCILIVAIYGICYYTRGHVRNTEFDYGSPQLYTLDEVKNAGDIVTEDFKTCGGFKGCRLKRLYYDEKYSEEMSLESKNETIVFRAYYKVGLFPPLNEIALTENDCSWMLERKNAKELWKIVNVGEP